MAENPAKNYVDKVAETFCFPEKCNILVRIVLFPYELLFLSVSLNWLLNGLINKSPYQVLYGSMLIFIIWGGFFGMFGMILDMVVFHRSGGLFLFILFALGIFAAYRVGRARYNHFKKELT